MVFRLPPPLILFCCCLLHFTIYLSESLFLIFYHKWTISQTSLYVKLPQHDNMFSPLNRTTSNNSVHTWESHVIPNSFMYWAPVLCQHQIVEPTPTLTTAVKAQKAQVILSEEGGVTFGLHQTSQFPNAMVPLCWHRHPHTKYMVLIWCLVVASLLVSQLVRSYVVLSFVHCFLAQSLHWTLYIMNSWIIINPFLLRLVHFLIGVNSDGHSTLANYWQNRDQNPGLCT